MRKYFRYLIVIVLLVSAINLIDFKEESTDKINNDEIPCQARNDMQCMEKSVFNILIQVLINLFGGQELNG